LRPALGTFVSVHCVANDSDSAERAVASAFACFEAVQRLMHPASAPDLIVLRSAAPGRAIRVHRWVWDILVLSAEVNEVSEGRFDPCLPDIDGCMSDVGLPEPGIVVPHRPVALDFGGIAKGFAIDRAVDRMVAAGCSSGTVNAGGDVRVFGARDVPIWMRTWRERRCVVVRNAACAVSDPMARDRPSEHRGYYNRVTPELLNVDAAAVVAPTAAIADALTKCVLLCRQNPVLLTRTLSHFDATAIELAGQAAQKKARRVAPGEFH
jgi:thiamine biosynthesis lipoprotein